jgi:hypothetical protein
MVYRILALVHSGLSIEALLNHDDKLVQSDKRLMHTYTISTRGPRCMEE